MSKRRMVLTAAPSYKISTTAFTLPLHSTHRASQHWPVFMAALRRRCGHYIFVLFLLSSSSSSYCSDVTQRKPTKLCTMFGRLLDWYTIKLVYIFGGSCPWRNFATCKVHFASKSCGLLYWQRYCTAREQWALAKLCGVVSSRDKAVIPFEIGWSNCLVLIYLSDFGRNQLNHFRFRFVFWP